MPSSKKKSWMCPWSFVKHLQILTLETNCPCFVYNTCNLNAYNATVWAQEIV